MNKLNVQLVELQNKNAIEAEKTYSLNQYILWGSVTMFVVLLIIILLQYKNAIK